MHGQGGGSVTAGVLGSNVAAADLLDGLDDHLLFEREHPNLYWDGVAEVHSVAKALQVCGCVCVCVWLCVDV